MRGLNSGTVDMIYLDPPFNSKKNYVNALNDGEVDFTDIWNADSVTEMEHKEIAEICPKAYDVIQAGRTTDGPGMKAYLTFMGLRLVEMERILKPNGTIFLHCDDRADSHLKNLMTAVFGKAAYKTTITWQRSLSKNDAVRSFGRTSDRIHHFSLPGAYFDPPCEPLAQATMKLYCHNDGDGKGLYRHSKLANPSSSVGYHYEWKGYEPPPTGWCCPKTTMQKWDEAGLIHYPEHSKGIPDLDRQPQKKIYLTDKNGEKRGKKIGNVWTDINGFSGKSKERVNYRTQKPEPLLRRIVKCSTREGDLVFDPFCGCATALVVADEMRRNWIGCDRSPVAVTKLKERIAESQKPFFEDINVFDVREELNAAARASLPKRTDLGAQKSKSTIKEDLYGKQQGYCFGCWHRQTFDDMEIDHKNPKKKGGQNEEDNYQLLCRRCNGKKNAKTMAEWRAHKRNRNPKLFEDEEARRREAEEKLRCH